MIKVTSPFLQRFQLDKRSYLLSARAIQMIKLYFDAINVRGDGKLDDVQLYCFLNTSTNLTDDQINTLFDVFDINGDGSIDFDEFYVLVCMLVAIHHNEAKPFLFKHSRTCFELLDGDANESVSKKEFAALGFLFGYSETSVDVIFNQFELNNSSEVTFEEFKMFVIAAIDIENEELEKKKGEKAGSGCSIL
ncbi:hypothetical protein RCL1_007594 [Eukaryota sp. TZLM3-RCL]